MLHLTDTDIERNGGVLYRVSLDNMRHETKCKAKGLCTLRSQL